jgi:hypothetical protein
MQAIARCAAVAAIAAAATLGATHAMGADASQSGHPDSPSADVLPACPTEDSANCVWDARKRGNHEGRSFVDVNGHRLYLDGFRPFRDVEGHHGCEIKPGPTSVIRCADGFRTTS